MVQHQKLACYLFLGQWKVSHHWPPNNWNCFNNWGFRFSFYDLPLRLVGIPKRHIGECVRCDGQAGNRSYDCCYCLRVHFDTCIKGAAILIRPLPKHCLQGGGNICDPGGPVCLTWGIPVPSHAGHSISVPTPFGFSFFMKFIS
jgi:hypothetical protein